MRALGFDPSKRSCGWAVFDGKYHVAASGAETCPHDQTAGVKGIEAAYSGAVSLWASRLARALITKHGPDAVIIEEPAIVGGNSVHSIHIMAAVFSGLASGSVEAGVRVFGVPQQTWRAGIGVRPARRGLSSAARSKHNKVEAMHVARLTGTDPKTHDEAEAILIAQWGLMQLNPRFAAAATPLMAAAQRR